MHGKERLALLLTLVAFAGLTVPLLMPQAKVLAASSSPQAHEFTVIVNRHGFNGTAGTFSITINQGDSVRITFVYGDDDLTVDNPHAIMFEGYGIQTVNIGKSNPTTTVQFVADVSGTFNFYCYVPCLGMETLLGHLIVTPSQGTRGATTLDLTASNTSATSFLVSATVKDANGNPMPDVPVKFYENTTFGKLFLKTIPTNAQGLAMLNYTATRIGSIQLIAENQGTAQYANSGSSIFVTVAPQASENEGTLYLGVRTVSQPTGIFYGIPYPPNLSMIAVPRVMNILTVAIAGIVVLSVWATYAYVGRQILSLRKQEEYNQMIPGLIPVEVPPLDITPAVVPDVSEPMAKATALLFLVPLIGVADVMMLNILGLPGLLKLLVLVALALSETVAIVLAVTGKPSD